VDDSVREEEKGIVARVDRYTGLEAAARLGVSYGKLLQIVKRYDLAVEREGARYVWNDETLERAGEALKADAMILRKPPPNLRSSQDVCELLGLGYDALIKLVKIVERKGGNVERIGRYFVWSDELIEAVRVARQEVEAEAARLSSVQGASTGDVAKRLGLSASRLTALVKRHGINVPRKRHVLVWDEASIEKAQALSVTKKPERSGREVAASLGVIYAKLYWLVHRHQIPLTRGEGFIIWGDDVLEAVRRILTKKRTGRARTRLSKGSSQNASEADARKRGLSTLEVCKVLGLDYPVFLTVIRPLRGKLPLERQGQLLIWTSDAIAMVQEALSSRSIEADRRLEEGARARSRLERLAALQQDLYDLMVELAAPPATPSFINSLPSPSHGLLFPLQALVYRCSSKGFRAVLVDLDLEAMGSTPHKALRNLRERLWSMYCEIEKAPHENPEEWSTLIQLIAPNP